MTLFLQVVAYGLALWLGLYLIERDPRNTALRLAGLGLFSYALALGVDVLEPRVAGPGPDGALSRFGEALPFLPALLWSGAVAHLLPPDSEERPRLVRAWRYGCLPIAALLLTLPAEWTRVQSGDGAARSLLAGVRAVVVVLPLLLALGPLSRSYRSARSRGAAGLLLVAALLLTLSTAMLLLPLGMLPRTWILLSIGVDLLLLGVAVAVLDAFDQGEALLPHLFRSFDYSLLAALLLGGQVALAMLLGGGATPALLALLLALIATAVATQVFLGRLQAALDQVAFGAFPRLRERRAALRAEAEAAPRLSDDPGLEGMDEAEFARLTRRALGQMGDLPRLAANPLTRLPALERRLALRGARDDALERAIELKALLGESIERLKPRGKGEFGTSDEWRPYNALYFPYVAGLKPYSSRARYDKLSPSEREALEWLRAEVPERTLYNWQSAAAKLVALDLRETSGLERVRS